MKFIRLVLSTLLFNVTFLGSLAHAMPIFTPAGLNLGDTYQLVFVTSTTRDATSSSIADYNAFAQAAGDTLLISLGGAAGDVAWSAIGSTSTVDARDNALVVGPVFNLQDEKVADDFSDMWDGDIDNAIRYDEHGLDGGNRQVWTGSFVTGIPLSSAPLGNVSGSTDYGISGASGVDWIFFGGGGDFSSQQFSMYALSEELTVTAPVPEPSTILLLGISALGLIGSSRRKKFGRRPKSRI